MSKKFSLLFIGLLLTGLLFSGCNVTTTGSGVPSSSTVEPTGVITGCAIATTAPITTVDKFDSSLAGLEPVKYKVNDGGVQTDTDGVISNLNKGDKLTLLLGYNNASKYIAKRETMDITKCGANTKTFNIIPNATVTLRCFNEEGNVIDNSNVNSTVNETIGTGEAPTLRCEMAGVAKTGFPYGGVIVAEMSGTAYKENEFSITGLGSVPKEGLTGDPVTQARGAYTLSASANKVVAVEVAPFEGAVVKSFYVYIPAEDSQNPDNNDINLSFYPNACYDEEDVSKGDIRCGMTDLDNSFVMSPAGTTTIEVT